MPAKFKAEIQKAIKMNNERQKKTIPDKINNNPPTSNS